MIVIFVLLGIVPFLLLLGMSSGSITLRWEAPFFAGGMPWDAVVRSFFFAAIASAFQLIVALLAGRFLFASKSLRRIILHYGALSLTLPPLAVALLWRVTLTEGSPLNRFLDFLGIPTPPWLSTVSLIGGAQFSQLNFAHITVFLVESWVWVPFVLAVVVIAVGHIPCEIIDTAMVDGASNSQLYRKIIIPWILEPITWVWLLRFVDSYRVFDTYWVLFKSQGDIRPFSVEIFGITVQRYHFQEGSKLALLGLIIGVGAALVALKRSGNRCGDGLAKS